MNENALPGIRRRARELAFRVLFESEQGQVALNTAWDNAMREINLTKLEILEEGREGRRETRDTSEDALLADGASKAFAHQLVLGFDEKRDDVDATLEGVIEGWSFVQMAKTDLNILRIAAFEMMFLQTPHPPVIEVAVRIAKKFGGEESGGFVNGVLAKLKTRLETTPQR